MDAELKQYLEAMEARTREQMAAMEARTREQMEAMEARLREHTETVETTLLTEFWKWARTADARYRQAHSAVGTLDERVQLVEDRVAELERRAS